MKRIIKLIALFFILTFGYGQKVTVNADKYTIKGVGTKQTKFYTNKAFFNTLVVGDTATNQSEPFHITTNARFDGKINLNGSYGTVGTYFRSSGNGANPTWSPINWSEIANKPVFGNYLPLLGGTMTGEVILNNAIRVGGRFGSLWLGKNALIGHTFGSFNTAIGDESLPLLTGANYNTALGATTLNKNTASGNTAIGGVSMSSNITGQYNTAVGISSLANNLIGSYNVVVGSYAGQFLLGTGNAIFGGYTATSERTRQNSMFLANGSGALNIFADSLNNIGIGTTRPKTKLQINYDNSISYISNYPSGYGNIHLQPLGSGSTGISFGANTTSGGTTNVVNAGIHVASNVSYGTRMRFSTSNNLTNGALSRMIIDENGKVGIGNDTPAEMLDVTGNLKVSAEIRNTYLGTGLVHSSSIGTFSSSLLVNQDVATGANIDASKLGTGAVSNAEFNYLDGLTSSIISTFAPLSQPVFLTNTTSPLYKITGAGDIGNGGALVMGGNSNDLTIHGTGKVILGTGNFQRLVVTNSGNVGIGTPLPLAKFEVSGLAGFRYNDGKQADGKYLRSNSTGVSLWDSVRHTDVMGLSSIYAQLSTNNNFTGSNLFLTPIFANSTSTSSFSSMTPEWTNTGNLGTFRWRYNTKVGSNTVTWYPLNMDTNGWVGIGMQPTQAFEVLGAAKFNSGISTTTLGASGAVSALSYSSTTGANFGTSSGNVGIGLANPLSKLHINSSNSVDVYSRYTGTSSVAGGFQIGVGGINQVALLNRENTDMEFYNNNSLKAIIKADGKFGIGVTNPTSKLTIGSVDANTLGLDIAANNTVSQSFGMRLYGGTNANDYALRVKNIADTQEYFFIRGDGNVGIGDINPSKRLTVASPSGDYGQYIYGNGTAGNNNGLLIDAGLNSSDYSFRVRSGAGAEYLAVRGDGKIGIGTTSPTAKLDVAGTLRTNGGYGDNFLPYTDGKNYYRANEHIFADASTSQLFAILGNGTVQFKPLTTTQINAISSPVEGMEAWNTTLKLKCTYNGTNWKRPDGVTNM